MYGPMSALCASHVRGCPVFYGYVVAFIGTIGMVATGPGQTPVVGTTITAIDTELGIARTTIASLYLVATILSACTLPHVGRLLDRVGPQPLFGVVVAGLGLTCIVFSAVVYTKLLLCVAFYFLRLCGQGSLTLVSQNAINLWFRKKRGRVMGVCSFVNSLCLTGIFSSIVKRLVSAHGWRWTYNKLGLLEWCLVLPLGLLLMRQKPETYGLCPDGEESVSTKAVVELEEEEDEVEEEQEKDTAVAATGSDDLPGCDAEDLPLYSSDEDGVTSTRINGARPSASHFGRSSGTTAAGGHKTGNSGSKPAPSGDFTQGEALRTLGFWAMSMGGFTSAALGTALFFHLDAIFSQAEYNTYLDRVYLSSAITAGCTTLVVGLALDVVRPQLVMVCGLLCLAAMLFVSSLIVRTGAGARWLFLVGVLNGLSSGSIFLCCGVTYATWFGVTHNGKIQGLANSLVVLGSAVGPVIISIGHDFLGSYHKSLLFSAAWPLACALLAATARSPLQS